MTTVLDTRKKTLWFYHSTGDGVHWPMYGDCQEYNTYRFCDTITQNNLEMVKEMPNEKLNIFIEENLIPRQKILAGRSLQLVEKQAVDCLNNCGTHKPPIPLAIINQIGIKDPIEIRLLPLKAYHGAVWHIDGTWIIHVNNRDSETSQRQTVFHELFHIIANANTAPLFRNVNKSTGVYDEKLADSFAFYVQMPQTMVRAMWAKVRDRRKMAEIFHVSPYAMWYRLKGLEII